MMLIISCALTTVAQKQAINLVNAQANQIMVFARGSGWFLAVGWLALTFGILGAGGWGFVGLSKSKADF